MKEENKKKIKNAEDSFFKDLSDLLGKHDLAGIKISDEELEEEGSDSVLICPPGYKKVNFELPNGDFVEKCVPE